MTNAAFKLEDAGFTREQIDALTEFLTGSVATKEDIARLEGKIETQGAYLKGEINTIKWMFGVLIAINIGVALKLLFG